MHSRYLLLFDLGGVLIENATFARLSVLSPRPADASALKDRWLASPAVRRFELGETSPDEFARAFIDEWGITLSLAAFLAEFTAWPVGFYPGARALLRSLRERYRVGCLSNSNVLHWEKFGGFKEDFDIALASHRLGAIKPQQQAFVRALEVCGAAPPDVYFFDDSPANVDAAKRLGIRAFHVDGIGQLRDVLRAQGLG